MVNGSSWVKSTVQFLQYVIDNQVNLAQQPLPSVHVNRLILMYRKYLFICEMY